MAGSPNILTTPNKVQNADSDSSMILVLRVSNVWVMPPMNSARAKITDAWP